jgi:hypothetical protein
MLNKYLFVFINNKEAIVETKLLDMPEGTPPEKVYFWLKLNIENGTCEKLDFVSMKKGEPLQERVFKQGTLSFDADTAMFNDGYYLNIFANISKDDIPEYVKETVSNFLKTQQ